jgi:dihydrofolate reductase
LKNYVYIGASLDGYIAGKDGNIDWLNDIPNPDGSDFGFSEFIKGIDAIVMGRNTFETVVNFGSWPYTKPVFVLSSSIKQIPSHLKKKVEIMNGAPEKIVTDLNARNYNNLYIDGGKTIQEFLKREMIDEMIITRIPVLLGEGIPLFAELDVMQKFEHINTEVLSNTIVKSHYRKIVK